MAAVITLVPPVAVLPGQKRKTGQDRDWQLIVFDPAEGRMKTHFFFLDQDEEEGAKAQAAALIGGEVSWSPAGRSFRGEVQ
jgi:hypothetical protein